ncbi:MAG TPA: YARHG domain-containing protein [Caulobacteraceae bacterium]|jgi:hypothetical protein
MDAGVIGAAATSTLGILALLVLVISGLATAFFREASTAVKFSVFILMFGATVMFGVAVVRQASVGKPSTGAVAATVDSPAGARTGVLAAKVQVVSDGQLLPDSSSRLIQPSELAGLSAADLRIARNEIYARHGYVFHAADLRDHFAHFAWYAPTQPTVTLTPIEQRNVGLFAQQEKVRAAG